MKFAHNIIQGMAITMDCQDYITESAERKKGQHLQREERGAIQHLKNAGYTNRAIARAIGCSPTTVGNELKRGTPPRKSSKGRKPGYSARRGEAAYKANRKRSRKPHRICHCTRFIRWIMEQVKEHKWSLDACVGYARLHGLFSAEEMVCTHTLYNEVWAGSLDLSVTELPEAMKRKQHKGSKPREHKKNFGTDISQRPEIAALRIEEGHWEGDTVVGKRAGKEAVVLSLLEKKTENYARANKLQPAERKLPQFTCTPADRRDCGADHHRLRHAAGTASQSGGQTDRFHLSGVRPGAVHDL